MQLQFSHIDFIALCREFCFDYKTFSKTYISIFHAPTIPIVSEVFHDIATLECNYGLVFNNICREKGYYWGGAFSDN